MNNDVLIPYILRTTAQHICRVMKEVSGHDPLDETRRRPVVIARTFVAYRLLLGGFSEHAVGKILGWDHSTVNHYRRRAAAFLTMPEYYQAENELWKKFNEAI